MEIPEQSKILVERGVTYRAKEAINCLGCAFFDKTYQLLINSDCSHINCMPETDEGFIHLIYVEVPDGDT